MIVCLCTAATKEDIIEASEFCKDFDEMQDFTGAGTGCQSCLNYVMQIWEDIEAKQRNDRTKTTNPAIQKS